MKEWGFMKKQIARILVAGDVILDTYIYGKVERISPEAPIPVLYKTPMLTRYSLGGAANVAYNMMTAGAGEVDIFSIIGNDEQGKILLKKLKEVGIGIDMVAVDHDRPTTEKLRYIGQNNQQLLRVDMESRQCVRMKLLKNQCEKLEKRIQQYSVIVLSDYLKGFLSIEITDMLIKMAMRHHIPVLIDIKDKNYFKYQGAYLLKPNKQELHEITGMDVSNENNIIKAANFLCRETKCKYILVTMGSEGMMLISRDGLLLKEKSIAREIYDVTGAGDTAMAYLAVGVASGESIEKTVEISNVAAGIKVSKLGTGAVYLDEVTKCMDENKCHNKRLKNYKANGLKPIVLEQQRGKKIVFTNGCFDLFHIGHVKYLQKAKQLGDCLVVGINSDTSVKRIKGEDRPINNCEERMALVAALECVDYVVEFEEDTPLELIKAIMPDVLVKGGDYKIEDIVGKDIVEANGGTVHTIPYIRGKSTTELIDAIRNIGRA